jgi:sulfonate transport system substrate-binding protein
VKRTFALLVALLVLVGGGIWIGTRGGASAGPVLHVGNQKGTTKTVMIASGALEGAPYTVEWSEFPAAQHLLEAIGGGAVDIGLVGDAPFQFAYQAGSPVVAVGAHGMKQRPAEALAIVVPANSAIHTMADLRGKQIATTRGSIGHYLALEALDRAKLPADGVRFTFLAPGDAKAAFSSGAVDAWATWVPYLTSALGEQARVIADGRDYGRSYSFQVANRSAVATKRMLIADFLNREAKALAWSNGHPDEYARALSAETGLPADLARVAVGKNARIRMPINEDVIAAQREVLNGFVRAGALTASRPVEAGYDTTFSQSPTPQG